MKKRSLSFLAGLASLSLSACNPIDLFFPDEPIKPKDTLVLYVSADSSAVRYKDTDTTHHITVYWLDGRGQRLFKMSEEFFCKNRWDSARTRWSREGLLLHQSNWDNGVCTGIASDWYENGQLAHEVHFDQKGNKYFEMYFHPNGARRTDTILYDEGKLHGDVRYYDTTGNKVLQTYNYVNDQLVGVKINSERYNRIMSQVQSLEYSINRANDTTTHEYRERQRLLGKFAVKVDSADVW